MKFLSLFLVIVFLLSCTTIVQEKKNPLEGTWELISGKWSTPDTTFTFPETDYHHMIKMIGKMHFVFVNQDTSREEYYGFGGGTYTLEGGDYTEKIDFFSNPDFIGHSFSFKFQIEGDQFTISGTMPLKELGLGENDFEITEIYKRLD